MYCSVSTVVQKVEMCSHLLFLKYNINVFLTIPGDLNTWKRTGTSRQLEIHFSIKTTEYLP